MIGIILAGFLPLAAAGAGEISCADVRSTPEYHLSDACDPFLAGNTAYSITYRASLSPMPASQQVMIFRTDDGWFMSISGYRWDPDTQVVVTRRNEVAISFDEFRQLSDRLTEASINKLASLPYYGARDVICTDGAKYEIAVAKGGKKLIAEQHSCAGKTEINEIAAAFRDLALTHDPEFENLLSGLKN
ncbi:hypothetical protein [Erythrobacter donghaensis]|uniref:hypothetical protein n=1 Tax=Erythrobacter donghaensis TaxID=267135 RepID=UPI00117CA47F|nr:hypothetical protein [Erythrobacter donghaensis]